MANLEQIAFRVEKRCEICWGRAHHVLRQRDSPNSRFPLALHWQLYPHSCNNIKNLCTIRGSLSLRFLCGLSVLLLHAKGAEPRKTTARQPNRAIVVNRHGCIWQRTLCNCEDFDFTESSLSLSLLSKSCCESRFLSLVLSRCVMNDDCARSVLQSMAGRATDNTH